MAKFHSLCDGKSKTITVIKTTTGYILGGYTSISWTSSGGSYIKDSTAFLYSLTNPSNMSLKLPVLTCATCYGVYITSSAGPSFGYGGPATADLYIADLSNVNTKSLLNIYSFLCPNGVCSAAGGNWMHGGTGSNGPYGNFQTVEIEVFLVT